MSEIAREVSSFMNRLTVELKNLIIRRRVYFQYDERRIARENLSILKKANFVIVILLILFLILTPYILKDWHASLQHIMFVRLSAFSSFFPFSSKRK